MDLFPVTFTMQPVSAATFFLNFSGKKRICMISYLYFHSKHDKLQDRGSGCILTLLLLCYLKTVIFQQMREKPTKLIMYLLRCCRNVTGRIVFLYLAGRFYAYRSRFLVGPLAQCLGAFGYFHECFQACWISQRKLRNRHTYMMNMCE